MKLIQGRYRYASAHDMYEYLGVKRLPDAGMPERLIDGVRVYVKPLPVGKAGQRQSLRVTAICDDCGQHVPVGRMHQHLCCMPTWQLMWSPTGQPIATVRAMGPRSAVRKTPKPYRKALGEVYAVKVKE